MHNNPKVENYNFQAHLIFDKNKDDIFLHDLKNELFPLSSMEYIENLYHNFATNLSSSVNKFSVGVLTKMRNTVEPTPGMIKSVKMKENKFKKLLHIW